MKSVLRQVPLSSAQLFFRRSAEGDQSIRIRKWLPRKTSSEKRGRKEEQHRWSPWKVGAQIGVVPRGNEEEGPRYSWTVRLAGLGQRDIPQKMWCWIQLRWTQLAQWGLKEQTGEYSSKGACLCPQYRLIGSELMEVRHSGTKSSYFHPRSFQNFFRYYCRRSRFLNF